MKTYLVGGWVRDYLRGQPSQDRDWVVVGATEKEMLSQGFKSVGASFPVFLHPKTKEEYALARQEKKVSAGYHGFSVISDPSVTLAEDLSRRDLTINAMAYDPITAEVLDPFHGQQDWRDKCLRHVSSAFADDPLRLVRLARFYAVFPEMTVHDSTLELCYKIVASGELQALVPERVRLEVVKMYQTSHDPHRFWQLLDRLGALTILFPQLGGIHFDASSIPSTFETSDPFVAGLIWLNKLVPTSLLYKNLLFHLRASRSELALIAIAQALDLFQTLTSDDLVALIVQTRALHELAPLQKVYHWNATCQTIPWAMIETATHILKHADLHNLNDIEPIKRKAYLFDYYKNILQISLFIKSKT